MEIGWFDQVVEKRSFKLIGNVCSKIFLDGLGFIFFHGRLKRSNAKPPIVAG